jgi:hypothetical protein
MNYLILTPDGVGSNLLQRALTIYLNSAGLDYYNTPNLENGIFLKNSKIYRDRLLEKTQSFEEIESILSSIELNLISVIHEKNQSKINIHSKEDRENFFKFCNQYYTNIVYCVRNPYENALSLSISKQENIYNVLSVKQRIKTHNKDKKYNINLNFFKKSLDKYNNYHTWVFDNFPDAVPLDYNKLNFDIDTTIKNLCNVNFSVKERFGISINDYSKILYQVSLLKQDILSDFNHSIFKEKIKNVMLFYKFQQSLITEGKLFACMPIKSNTLDDKKQKIINFHETIEVYNNWAKNSNYFSRITEEQILSMISQEKNSYKII